MSHPAQRGSWIKPLLVSGIAGALAYQLWEPGQSGDDLACLASAVFWLVCVRSFFTGWTRLLRALEVHALRKRASRRIVPFNEERFDLLTSAHHPNIDAILDESRKLREETEQSAARRRLMSLEASIDAASRSGRI